MRRLLDTHALLWWFANDQRLSRRADGEIRRSDDVRVSAVSLYEIGIKRAWGKLDVADALGSDLPVAVTQEGFSELALTLVHADRAAALPFHHRDPFDRMLIAQALVEYLTLVANEQLFDAYGVKRLW